MKAALLILFLCLPALAGDEPVRLQLALDQIPETEDWFGVYLAGKKSGYARMILTRRDTHYEVRMNMKVHVTAMGQTVTIKVADAQHFALDAPHRYIGGRLRMDGGQMQQQTTAKLEDGQIVASVVAAGVTRRLKAPRPDYTLADGLAHVLWVRQPREKGAKITCRAFELMTFQPSLQTLEVESARDAVVRGVSVRHYELKLTSTVMGNVGTMRVSDNGEMLGFVFGGMFEMRREPKEIAKQIEKGGDLFVQSFAKVDEPLGDPRQLKELVVVVSGKGRDMLESGPRQSVVQLPELGCTMVAIGARRGTREPATPEEIAENLRETIEYPTRDEKLRALATMAVSDAKTDRDRVDRLVRFVARYVKDALRPEPVAVLELVKDPRGDCAEHAILFTTMARALGIPARTVTGIAYLGDKVQAFGGHAWNEVVLDGRWVPVDATWNETEIDAAHIRIGSGIKGLTAVGWTMGRLKLKVVSLQR